MTRTIEDRCEGGLRPVLVALRRQDPADTIRNAEALNRILLDAQAEVAAARRAAIRQMRATGWTLKEIGAEVGLSAQRIHQLETGYGRKEKRQDEQRLTKANQR